MGVAREQVRPADPCSGQDYRVAKTRMSGEIIREFIEKGKEFE